MEDSEIIQLYWDRSEQAIAETSGKYGSFLCRIALSLIHIFRSWIRSHIFNWHPYLLFKVVSV